MLVAEEPAEIFGPLERLQMQAIGVVKGHTVLTLTCALAHSIGTNLVIG